MTRTCDMCGKAAPNVEGEKASGGTWIEPWPFDWCPWCVDREISRELDIRADRSDPANPGTIRMSDIGTLREKDDETA